MFDYSDGSRGLNLLVPQYDLKPFIDVLVLNRIESFTIDIEKDDDLRQMSMFPQDKHG